jgi:adenylate kinase
MEYIMHKLVFFGAPGAGKGTLSKIMVKELNIPQISTGDLFRQAIKDKTELGLKVSSILEKGDLVPDELTIALVEERVKQDDCKNGYILDGFPRTMPQAEEWEKSDPIDNAIYFEIDDELVKKRLSGRRLCPKCGAIYNIYFGKPKVEGKCDIDGEDLITRKDDQEDAVINRLEVYYTQTAPLLDYYKKLNKVITIDASVNPDITFNQIKEKLGL